MNQLESILLKFQEKIPLVKILMIDSDIFLYDAKAGFLTQVTEEQLNMIYEYQIGNRNCDVPKYLISLFEREIFTPGGFTRIVPTVSETAELVKDEIANQIPRKFTLEITEKCTLRCKYCFYTNGSSRRHSQDSMSLDIACKGINYYFLRYTSLFDQLPDSRKKDFLKKFPPNLSWWGGEPFADFNLLRKTKEYFEALEWGKYNISKNDIFYSIATNLTILTEEIINFIVDNKVYLQVSLDGDRRNNDLNRVFIDGGGSFDRVISNINQLINNYPEYARDHIMIQSVLADNIDKIRASDFIKKYFRIYDVDSKILAWSPSAQRHEKEFLPRDSDKISQSQMVTDFRKMLSSISIKGSDNLNDYFINNKTIYRQLQELFIIDKQIKIENPIGSDVLLKFFSCPLGTDTLFVSRNGDLHCCCKVDQSFPIGNVSTGLSEKKIKNTYNSYFKKINQKCKECWAIHFCKICPALTCFNRKFQLPSKNECENIKKMNENTLIKYIIFNREFESLHFLKNGIKDFRFDSTPATIKKYLYYEKN